MSLIANNNYTKAETISIASAYYFPDHKGYKLNGDVAPVTYNPVISETKDQRDLGSTWGAAELMGTYKINLRRNFITGGTALTKDNNLKHSLSFGLSPVDVSLALSSTITPIAFLEFSLGSSIATGWKAIGVDGLARYNNPAGADDEPFQGFYQKTWLSGKFQFDLAAIMSGDTTWKHLIILSNHNINFKYFSGSNRNDPWIYQGGDALYNGFRYDHSSFIGYKMPLALDMAGLLVETGANLFDYAERSIMTHEGWGSDYISLKLGALLNFSFNKNHSIVILPQFKRNIRYTDSSVRNSYFAFRKTNSKNPTYWDFDRIAFSYTYKF